MKYTYRNSVSVQVREFIRTEIEEGDLAPGTKIPPESELMEIFGVQREIVRNAIDSLVKEGLLKQVDKDYYVLGAKIERNLEILEGFAQTMLDKKLTPSVKVISKVRRRAGNKYAQMFAIHPEDEIFYIKRICYANDETVSLEEIFIPQYLIPKMDGIDLSVFSVYEVYQMYGIKLKEAEQKLVLVRPNVSDARILGIETGMPVMLFQSVTYDEEGRAIEFNRNFVRGDKCNYHVHFSR
ncbi:MAG: GntR family transcriptional regulator [Dorea sp.]|nr:GntR family transcriptional regulator [Dorea sp.]